MTQEPSFHERKVESIGRLVLAVIGLSAGAGLLLALGLFPRRGPVAIWGAGLLLFGSLLLAVISRALWRRDRLALAGYLFLTGHVLLHSLLVIQFWGPGAAYLPYAAGLLIVAGVAHLGPPAGLALWLLAAVLPPIGLAMLGRFDGTVLGALAPPALVNLLLAGITAVVAGDRREALATVERLRYRARRRKEELFATREELFQLTARLQALEQELERTRQDTLTESDRRSLFVNQLGHELRTPLNAVVNFANILARGGTGPISPRQVDYLERIERSGWHVLEILNDLMDMAQIESGEFRLELGEVDLHQACEDVMRSVRGLILEKPVELVRDYPAEWPAIVSDTIRVKQALLNLLSNAARHTREGSISLQVRPAGEWVRIVVADTGPGIDPAYHEIIFREFHQIDGDGEEPRPGTGLGLAIARRLIERLGGQVGVESSPGQGSRFIVSLPLRPVSLTAPEPPAEASLAYVEEEAAGNHQA